jgi:outer membrane immunogenic protein
VIKSIFAAASVVAFAGTAQAGGPIAVDAEPMPAAAPAPVAAHDWSGPYIALTYGRVGGEISDSLTTYDYEDGKQAGIVLGYNFQRGNLVYGGELGYSSVSDAVVIGGGGDDELESFLDLRGRVGFSVGKALVYGALGYSTAKVTINGITGNSMSGTSYGLGVDYQMTERLFVGLDYTARELDGDEPFAIDTSTDTVSLRLGLSF